VGAQLSSAEVQVRLLVVRPEDEPGVDGVDYCVSLTFLPQEPDDIWRWEFHSALQEALGARRVTPHWMGRSRVMFRCRLDELGEVSRAIEAANRVYREYLAERTRRDERARSCG
jgi:hypothetical protein